MASWSFLQRPCFLQYSALADPQLLLQTSFSSVSNMLSVEESINSSYLWIYNPPSIFHDLVGDNTFILDEVHSHTLIIQLTYAGQISI